MGENTQYPPQQQQRWFVPVTEWRLEQDVISLEKASYPEDEAASADQLRDRFQHAGNYFWMALRDPAASVSPSSSSRQNRELIGYICATASTDQVLSKIPPHFIQWMIQDERNTVYIQYVSF